MSKAKKKISLKRTVANAKKRKLVIDKIRDQDLRWLFSGYKMGAFPEQDVPKGMDVKPFISFVENVASQYSHTLTMRDKDGRVLSLLLVNQILHMLEARTYHMPWAPKRDILAGAIMYFGGIAGEHLGIKYCKQDELAYCKQLAKYGVLKKGGEIEDFYRNEEGESFPATIFHTKVIESPWIIPLKDQMATALAPTS